MAAWAAFFRDHFLLCIRFSTKADSLGCQFTSSFKVEFWLIRFSTPAFFTFLLVLVSLFIVYQI